MLKTITEVITNSRVDIKQEYKRMYEQFFELQEITKNQHNYTLHELATDFFILFSIDFRKGNASLHDYNEYYGFDFRNNLENPDSERLISFCEYIANIYYQAKKYIKDISSLYNLNLIYINTTNCMDKCGFRLISKDEKSFFVENKKEAIDVTKIVNDNLNFTIFEYNHYKMKGDLKKKKASLLLLAYDIEPQKKMLKSINKNLQFKLFNLLNTFIKHNYTKRSIKKLKYQYPISESKLEEIYDEIYQMWLTAKLELDTGEQKKGISKFLKLIHK